MEGLSSKEATKGERCTMMMKYLLTGEELSIDQETAMQGMIEEQIQGASLDIMLLLRMRRRQGSSHTNDVVEWWRHSETMGTMMRVQFKHWLFMEKAKPRISVVEGYQTRHFFDISLTALLISVMLESVWIHNLRVDTLRKSLQWKSENNEDKKIWQW